MKNLNMLVENLYSNGHLRFQEGEDMFYPVWTPCATNQIMELCMELNDDECGTNPEICIQLAEDTRSFREISNYYNHESIEQQEIEDWLNCRGTCYGY